MRILHTFDDTDPLRVLVQLESGEVADLEAMSAASAGSRKLLSLHAALVSTGALPADLLARIRNGQADVPYQFGLPPVASLKSFPRIYELKIGLGR